MKNMHRFGGSSKKKAKQTAPVHPPAVGASTSVTIAAGASQTSTRKDVLQNTSTGLEILKSVGDAAPVLGPLKAVCGVLKIMVDTAVSIEKNGEDLGELTKELRDQLDVIEAKIRDLSNPEFIDSQSDIQGLVNPLEAYVADLKGLQTKLDAFQQQHGTGAKKLIKRVWKVQSDQEEIAGYARTLDKSFQRFLGSVTNFTAAQTVHLRAQVAALQKHITDRDAKDALSQLAYADARGNQHDVCLEGTRSGILESIAHWANDNTLPPVFALVDQAGTGKSTVATHMARKWEKDNVLMAKFFFAKPSTVTGKDVASTVAKDIATSIPSLHPLIVKAIEEHPNINACSIREQLDWIVFNPLKSLETPSIIIIDALDECLEGDRAIILDAFLAFISTTERPPVKLFLTCRPERNIISRLRDPKYTTSIHQIDFSSDLENGQVNQDDIIHYANIHLRNILSSDEEVNQFVKRANRLFIWASTARRFLEDAYDPSSLLKELITKDSTLNSLYTDILASVSGKQEDILMKVLQAICVAREPLRLDEIDEILGLKDGIAGRVVASLRSVLSDGSGGQTVQVLHPTFIEFLLGTDAGRFGISSKKAEALMANGCIKTCITHLKYDICDIHHRPEYPPLNKDVLDLEKRLEERTVILQYAAIYGPSHAASSLDDKMVVDRLQEFFNSKLLNWIELMSLYGKIYSLIQSIQYLKTRIEESLELSTTFMTSSDLDWCLQIGGMVQAFQAVIEESAMQVYSSALAFEPPTSYISRLYLPLFVKSIPKIIRGTRNLQSQSIALCGHTGGVMCIAYSPDGHTIASGSDDGTVRLWDASTGAAVAEITGHTGKVSCLAFSPNGKILASGSDDCTVRLWDPSTSATVAELAGHTEMVRCLAFSLDGRILASGSDDCTIRLWDSPTGVAVAELTGHTHKVYCLAFSPDGKLLASGSYDYTVRLWDPSTSATVAELTGHTREVYCLAFSPNGKILASGSFDYSVRLWDASTSTAVAQLTGHSNVVRCLAFSRDGKMLASGSYDNTVRLWDPSTGVAVSELTGHTRVVSCLAFSPDGKVLASGSFDYSVRIWDPSTGATVAELTGHTDMVNCLTFSSDGKILASGSDDRTVRFWDPSPGSTVEKLTGHTREVHCLAFSPDGKMLASGSVDQAVRLWDPSTGTAVAELSGHTSMVSCLAFSPDGKILASGSYDNTVRLWDPSTGVAVAELTGHAREVYCLAFSPDGKILASGSFDYSVRLWDPSTSTAVTQLTGHSNVVRCLAFSPDGKILASGSYDRTVQLWDPSTGVAVWEPLRHAYEVEHLNFNSQNGNLVLEVEILGDPKTLWNMSTNPPSRQSSEGTPPSSPTLISSFIQFDGDSKSTRISNTGISFHLPPYFPYRVFCSHDGIAAYGGEDGSIIIIDCSHLV